jgi:hypothetical protein
VPAVLWIALIVGAAVTIGFAMIFGMRSTLLHTLMIASLTAPGPGGPVRDAAAPDPLQLSPQ